MPNTRVFNKDYRPPSLDSLDELHYCIGCVNQVDGRIGHFGYSVEMFEATGAMWAITEVFEYVDDLYSFARSIGFTEHPTDEMMVIRRPKV